MLKCISCGREFPEVFNVITCPHCSNDEIHNWLYSTTFKVFPYRQTPCVKMAQDVWFKREDEGSRNNFLSTKTFKDRKSNFIKWKYKSIESFAEIGKFSLASSGNMAISFGKITCYAPFTKLYISPHVDRKKLEAITDLNYREINFTDKILTTMELTMGESDRWNITNGMDPIGASAYYSLGLELEPYNFDNIIVPCGSGELYSALAVYFHLLRKIHPRIIPIGCKLPQADAINTEFVACQPFIHAFANCYECGDQPVEWVDNSERIKYYAELYNCEFSSATVFAAYEDLDLKGRTCLVVTGGKK